MGMIRVSDDAEKKIKAMADGRPVTATVDKLVARNDIAVRLDNLATYLERSLKEMKKDIIKAIEDTTIDRVESGGARFSNANPSNPSPSNPSNKFYPWDNCVQDLYFDFPEDDSAWLPNVREMWGESSAMDMYTYVVKNGYLCSEPGSTPLLVFTPEVQAFLDERNTDAHTL